MAYHVQKEDYTTREHSLTDNTVFVTDLTTIDKMGKDLKSVETLENITQKEDGNNLGYL